MRLNIVSGLLAVLFMSAGPVLAAEQADPLGSPMWQYMRNHFLGDAPYQFDDRIRVELPEFAEDPTQVPVTVDASALDGSIEKIIVWADLNPIQHIFSYYPHPEVKSRVSLRFKVQQATAVRAAVLTKSGEWRVGTAYLDAAGGGCTTPSVGNADPYWESHLGEIQSRYFQRGDSGRYKFRVIHPMDTGLVDGIPEFFIEQVVLRHPEQGNLSRLELSQPVSENPVISFDLKKADGYQLWLRDNNGNEFSQTL